MSALDKLKIDVSAIPETSKVSPAQSQTEKSFAFKWARRTSYESAAMKDFSKKWLMERYCENDMRRLDQWLAGGRKIILDVGCGSGYSALLFFGERLNDHDYLGIDISDAVEVAKMRFREAGYPGDFLKMDILNIPIPENSVDIIFAEGVLHHTSSTEEALKYLSRKLKKGGRFLFYVYAKKAVIREFTDDYIRGQIHPLGDDEAWKALEPLTQLGKSLGDLNIELDIPQDIPYLGIHKGRLSIQRFFYWHICKMFYRPEFSIEEMNHINFDWFRPSNCHRHTPEEIRRWCQEAGLTIERMNVQESGITVVSRKS